MDGRTTDGRRLDGYPISSPCEPNGSGELKRGECRCRGLDLTQNHLKMEKKTKMKKKSEKKKIVVGAGFEPTTLRLQILHLTR